MNISADRIRQKEGMTRNIRRGPGRINYLRMNKEGALRTRERRRWRHWHTFIQGFCCFYCDGPITLETSTLDHFVPLASGGMDHRDNSVAACKSCNEDKGNRHGDDFLAILRLKEMPASTVIIGTAFAAAVAARLAHVWKCERSNALASNAAAALLRMGQAAAIPEPIEPDQDCTGDMPEKSSVRRSIEDTQARSNEFGGAQRLRYPERWRARFVEPRPDAPKRDWL